MTAAAAFLPGDAAGLDDTCARAMNLQLTGQLERAERLYLSILSADPEHALANHCLGMLKLHLQQPAEGLPYLLSALNTQPELPDYWLGYLEALLGTGQIQEARSALALAREHGLAGAAVDDFTMRLATHPTPTSQGSAAPPIAPLVPPTTQQSTRAQRRRLGRLCREQESALLKLIEERRFSEALVRARAMTDRFPEHGLSWKILGALLGSEGHMEEALAAMRRSAELLPNDAEAHSNLGTTLTKLNRYDEAEASHQLALQIDPTFATGHYRLGMTYEQQGRYAEAENSLRQGVALRRNYAEGQDAQNYSNLLFILSHNPELDGDSLFTEHRRYAEFVESTCAARPPRHLNSADPDRRLQIGFVSGDLHNHAVATFIEPVLSRLSLNPEFDLHGYYTNTIEDGFTVRLRGYFKHWRAVSPLSDADLAKRITDDGIDILIDLSGHTAMNRLPVFARKAAPLQVSWIGYPGTTGLRAMDYHIADPRWLPPGQFDRHFTEKLVYLPATAPFQPHGSAPAVNSLPALEAGFPTFGSFNRVAKINPATVRLWADLLLAVPHSRMLLGGMPADVPQHKLTGQFAAAGIAPDRLTFHLRGSMESYLALHHQTDICLDAYPYTGGTTTYHALWMGVPTLTVAGSTPAGRQGAAILAQIGLEDFIAADGSDFVRRGVHWAANPGALAEIRSGLRSRLADSSSQQPELIVAALERALRQMWRRWCGGLPPESFEINHPHLNGPKTP